MALTIAGKDINNEIVLLRQCVRQARICTINKLVREAKRLRTNHGNEKQLEKNKHKADKLLREIFALKRIKADEISRFGIVGLENLQAMLQNSRSDDRTRAIVKVVRCNSLNARITELTEKFPGCQEYISSRSKKHSQKRKRNNRVVEFPTENLTQSVSDKDGRKIRERIGNTEDSNDGTSMGRPRRNMKIDGKYKEPSEEWPCLRLGEKKGDWKNCTNLWKISDTDNCVESDNAIKAISKEATVKRFTDILQEGNTEEIRGKRTARNSQQLSTETIGQETVRKVDDFFLNSHEVTPHLNNPISSEEREANSVPNVNNKALRVRSERGKFRSDEVVEPVNIVHSKRNDVSGNARATNALESEKLHPSWAARRKEQEIIKQGFQGKKIRFDES
ncbi:serum response factor-binding protein 1 isoform X2 [Andrena cerasifolii]|uniref:serum response factor-binding protein 1 isoform X2 n=1 Tax=Andrena cerasifolii TaxID=2819439 RepID=UPI0040376497